MKLMDRYIMRELVVPFLAGSIVIALLFAANQLIFILKTFNVQNMPPAAMAQMILYKMPYWLNMTLPAGIALAASLAITRLARESEITAMRAVGTRVVRVALPVAVFGLLAAVGNWLLVEKVMPRTEQKARKLEIDASITSATPMFSSNVWLTLKQYHASFASVTREPDDSLKIEGVLLGERPKEGTTVLYTAPSGTYKDGIWTFANAQIWYVTPSKEKLTFGQADKIVIPQPIFLNDLFQQAEPEDKTGPELAAAIKEGRAQGHDMTREELAYYERFSIPGACLVFAVISPIFALMFARTGSFVGVLLSFVLVLVYYNSFVVSTEIIGRNHWVAPWLAAWMPNFVFIALGLIGVRRLE